MKPIATAPKDGREILAYHVEGKTFHPVSWHGDYWGMRWNAEYRCGDGHYSVWLPYPV